MGDTFLKRFFLPRWWVQLAQKGRGWVDEDELVVLFGHDGPLRLRIHIVEEHEVFHSLDWLTARIDEVHPDVDRKLAPANLVDLERRLSHRDQRVRERGVQLELNLGDEARDVLTASAANVAAPSVALLV